MPVSLATCPLGWPNDKRMSARWMSAAVYILVVGFTGLRGKVYINIGLLSSWRVFGTDNYAFSVMYYLLFSI